MSTESTKYPALLQVRNKSSRLPRKALLLVMGKSLIDYLVERIRAVPSIGKIIIATSQNPEDDDIEHWGKVNGVAVFRGSEDNVLERNYKATKNLESEYFVKFWGDSPLIDPGLCEHLINEFKQKYMGYDYISNNHPSTYPEGMQIEIIKRSALQRAYIAKDLSDFDREHVTPYIWRNPSKFRLANIMNKTNIHDKYRLAVDYPEDFELISRIITLLYPKKRDFSLIDIMNLIDSSPELQMINKRYYESEAAYYQRIDSPSYEILQRLF